LVKQPIDGQAFTFPSWLKNPLTDSHSPGFFPIQFGHTNVSIVHDWHELVFNNVRISYQYSVQAITWIREQFAITWVLVSTYSSKQKPILLCCFS